MDFLKDEFLDQLRAEIDDETGKVIIEAVEFTPQQILQEVNPTIFDTAFAEWCEMKKDERLEKAEEILDLFPSNRRRFEVLKSHFKSGSVIPFVGAGMSMPSGYAGWTHYLKGLLNETHVDQKAFNDLLSEYKYEEAAQMLFDGMSAGSFDEALENEFGHDLPIVGAIRFLPYLFTSSVITTNFDNVLKRCYDNSGRSFTDVLLGPDAIELPKLIGEEKNVLVKLHGKAISGRNRVLTFNEYEEHYANTDTLNKCIRAISRKTLLFLGCSLGVDRTLLSLKELFAEEGTTSMPRHYAFLKLEEEEERVTRQQQLAEANIYPIWYTGDHDQCIEALLEKLAEGIHQ